MNFRGADAIHLASALEMSCDEFLTFEERGPFKRAEELENLGLTVTSPRKTASLSKSDARHAKDEATKSLQGDLLADLKALLSASPETSAPSLPAPVPGSATDQSLVESAGEDEKDNAPGAAPAAMPAPTPQAVSENDRENASDLASIPASSEQLATDLKHPGITTNENQRQPDQTSEESNESNPESNLNNKAEA